MDDTLTQPAAQAPNDTGITRVRDGALLLLGIHRPQRKNALTGAMYAALAAGLHEADSDSGIHAVLLHGSEQVFCAGNDIGDFAKPRLADDERPSARFMRAALALRKPLVAAVNGPAVGIGNNARLGFPFARLGLCPEFASTLLLPATLGHQRAAELLLLGGMLDAAAAHAMGLVNAVLEPAAVLPHATAVAQQLCHLSPQAVQATKALMRGDTQLLAQRMRHENNAFTALLQTPQAQTAFAAFLKTAPASTIPPAAAPADPAKGTR